MDRDPQVGQRDLRKRLLTARCELDRRELTVEWKAIVGRVEEGAARVRSYTPWLLVLAPVAGFLLIRSMRNRRITGVLAAARWALTLRPLWPVAGQAISFLAGARPTGRG